ncbi:hypothetical protein ACJDU8_15615 [Clostridium sp. WILCCON 0269]|uniref:Uncharacterized protein n=1 Tax=Candidatus Clostridium eludens TaxID=3381663 RepID=A0ABW8SLS3_9CLOT
MKYILLQADIGDQIKIIDNSTCTGKKKVENLCMEGFKPIGYLESEQPAQRLLRGFNKNLNDKLEEKYKMLWDIQQILKQ